MKRVYLITIVTAVLMIAVTFGLTKIGNHSEREGALKVGFVYVGDSCDTYTNNFLRAQEAIELEYGEKVETHAKYNVPEGWEEAYIQELVDEGCELIFGTSYGYGVTMKKMAEQYPNIEFCMATGDNANAEPVLTNYHTFMGEIFEGRYISGVVAGMKMKELIDAGKITPLRAKIGYVAAFPYAEVISGYTAFFLGVRSVVPNAVMTVIYTNNWSDYETEKGVAERLIEEGCVIISQHSDTSGAAVACEEMSHMYPVYHVGYNQSMSDVAPTTSLISSRINWQHYMVQATGAVLNGKKIERTVKGNVHGNDVGGGFLENWVQMLKLNDAIAAKGTQTRINELIKDFSENKIHVFVGDYTGVNPYDPNDTIDLRKEYVENATSSAPMFHYVLDQVIRIEE